MTFRRFTVTAALCSIAPFLLAHEDDPKLLDRQGPVIADAWRASEGGPIGPAGDFPSSAISLGSWLPLNEFDPAQESGNDCWGYVSPSRREYALIGLSDGTAVVEVTDPGNAQVLDVITGPNSLWRDIKTYQNYAYAVSEGGNGIQVIDLTNVDSGVVTLVREVTTGGSSATHNVALDETSGFLYRCGGNGLGLRIYDLADPSNPVYVGDWPDRYVHDAQIVTYTEGPYAGRQIAFCCSGFDGGFDYTGLDILDVTDKSDIIQLARIVYPDPGYSHQAWLSPDRSTLYLDDELDEDNGLPSRMHVIDVSDLSNPYSRSIYTNDNNAITHNLYTRANYVYAANYRSGLRIFDVALPDHPVEVAYFDTYPTSDSASFNGLWSNYPQLPSGTLLGSDIERGLFVLRADALPLGFEFPDGRPAELPTSGAVIRFNVLPMHGGALQPGTVELVIDVDGEVTSILPASVGDHTFDAVLPNLPCGATVEYFIRAESTGGATMTHPPAGLLFDAYVADSSVVVFSDDLELSSGWVVGASGDSATTGVWTRVVPVGSDAAPATDHTSAGSFAFITGQGSPGGGVGDNDVDGGRTTLTSPAIDVSTSADPLISYYRWYSNDQGGSANADTFYVELSDDGGSSWVPAETVGPDGAGTSGGWTRAELRLLDYVDLTANVKIRFIAEDAGSGSIVEAGVDDLAVRDRFCDPVVFCPGDLNGDAVIDLTDLSILLSNFGASGNADDGDINGDGLVDLADLSLLLSAFGQAC